MNINATLFVQAMNFGIAYFLFRNFLFKPVYSCIQQDEAKKDALKNVISKQELRIDRIQEAIDLNLQTYKAFFKEHTPKPEQLEPGINRGIIPDISFTEPTEKEIVLLAQQTEKVIITMVGKTHE